MRYQNTFSTGPVLALLLLAAIATLPNTSFGRVDDDLKLLYRATVLNNDTAVQSGPGDVHYATQKLKQGDIVEVYREDPGGWCLIRPPEGSFSLVPQATLELVEGSTGRITQDGTEAWVGTLLGQEGEDDAVEAPLRQVKLKKGELVTVVGRVSWPDPAGNSMVWYQISPPAGEFRWIRILDIQIPATARTPSEDLSANEVHEIPQRDLNTVTVPTEADHPATQNRLGSSERSRHDGGVVQAGMQTESTPTAQDTVAINGGWRQAKRPISRSLPRGGASQNPNRVSDSNPSNRNRQYSGNLGTSEPPGAYRVADANVTSPNFARNLNVIGTGIRLSNPLPGSFPASTNVKDLETRLTLEMLKENPTQWELTPLESNAISILRNSQDPAEQAFARRYLEKLSNCKEIQTGYISTTLTAAPRTSPKSRPIGTGVLTEEELSPEVASTFDAHGWLNELVQGGGTTQSVYVLEDANGKITHHVQAAPQMNLQRYLRSRIGVVGLRGYHTRLKLDHVTVERVVVLEKPR